MAHNRHIFNDTHITPREVQIIGELIRGLKRVDIAKKLGIRTSTLKTTLERLRLRTQCPSVQHLILQSLQNGFDFNGNHTSPSK
jgi:DNA-binding CsgD family transcriptional regulator